ncbi:unnamed protein product [Caenorhabditis auriculariae]|uniref:Uncharacterized protein n=1 Tax=Caenorhabditis auriculariae TaxID=2777116 RepID=A0A8S1HHG5_9PELO|nr:unnamed protein product [Caenorhabditis auriculariae]
MPKFYDTGQRAAKLLLLLAPLLTPPVDAIILAGAPDSYARYPKWAHSFENSLSLELKTRQSDGLLLYTDDGNVNGNFYALTVFEGKIQLEFRLGDNSNDFGPRRPVNTIRIDEVRVDDDKWHTLNIFQVIFFADGKCFRLFVPHKTLLKSDGLQSWENVKLELDYTLVFKILNQRSFVFGNILKNSDVFVGGVPPDVHVLPTMSSPLRRYTRHLAVNVRNLVYRQYPQGVTSPQLLDAHGARHNEDDQCRATGVLSREKFFCQNGGVCYSTNEGPKCDCSLSEFEGKMCDFSRTDAELTFSGDEWVGYDLSQNVSGAVKAKRENLTLAFKTVHGTAMLFFSGDEKSYLHLMIKDGALMATSKFEGTDARMIRMFNSFPSERYDDDTWHDVVLDRSLQMMTLTVDGRKDEIRQYAPELDWIANSFAFLGSLPKENGQREVKYDVDATRILFVSLADQGYGGSVIRTGGELSYSCKDPTQPADVLSMISGRGFISLPKWDSLSSGSLSFHFRSSNTEGLILYHGVMHNNASDFIAFELVDGHLFFVINLGSGVVRLQTTAKKVSDAQWHHVHLERVGRTGKVIVDAMKIDFSTPGVSSNLIIDDPVYLGYVPNANFSYPPPVWTIALKQGFVGCIKNVRFNGISAKIADVYEQSNKEFEGVSLGCPHSNVADPCEPNPCENFGKCEQILNSFRCDCTATNMDGLTCNVVPVSVSMNGDADNLHFFPATLVSEVEHLHIRFKTESSRGVLFDTSAKAKADRFTVFLNESQLNLFIQGPNSNNSFSWGKSLSDNHWHYLQVRRLGQRIMLFLDGFWGHSVFLQHQIVIAIDELGSGISLHSTTSPPRNLNFAGQMSKMVFNGIDLLEVQKKAATPINRESKAQRNLKSKNGSVSFTNTTGYLVFSSQKISSFTGQFRVQFKFQTLVRSALLFVSIPSEENEQSFQIELHNSRVKYTYLVGGNEYFATSPKLPNRQHLSDMRWHSVTLYQEKDGDHTLVVDDTITALSAQATKTVKARLTGVVALGGTPSTTRKVRSLGFRGCLAYLRINEKIVDLLGEADSQQDVKKGCQGPVARCSTAACANGGRCIQQWTSLRCECSLTAHSGDRCQHPGTTVRFDGEPAAVYYQFGPTEMPTTSKDYLVFAFRTTQSSGVLFALECAADKDFFTIFLSKGFLHVRFNLGSRDHQFGYFTNKLNDGDSHVVKMYRAEANVTVQVDRMPSLRYRPKSGEDLVLLNMQSKLVVGASFNTRHLDVGIKKRLRKRRRKSLMLYDSYQGEISGVNFNGILMLDFPPSKLPMLFFSLLLCPSASNSKPKLGNVASVSSSCPLYYLPLCFLAIFNLQVAVSRSERLHAVGNVATTTSRSHLLENNATSADEDVAMVDFYEENPSEALIESIVPSCLSVEEQQNCYIQTDDSTGRRLMGKRRRRPYCSGASGPGKGLGSRHSHPSVAYISALPIACPGVAFQHSRIHPNLGSLWFFSFS